MTMTGTQFLTMAQDNKSKERQLTYFGEKGSYQMNKGGKYLDSKIGRETMLSNARNVSAVLNERQ